MNDPLPAPIRSRIAPLLDRWKSFLSKLAARVDEVELEADAGLDELIRISPLETNAFGTGVSAVIARFNGLDQKVESSVAKLEEEWDEIVGELDLEGDPLVAVGRCWDELRRQEGDCRFGLKLRHERLVRRKQADWARRLYQLALEELARPRACSACGASFQPEIRHTASNLKCTYCGALNELAPGSATGLYYAVGVHNLVQEKSYTAWAKLAEADRMYQRFHSPIEEDWQALLAVERAHWEVYYQLYAELHPGFDQTIEEAVSVRLARITTYEPGSTRNQRARRSRFLALARSGDRAALNTELKKDSGADLQDLIVSAVEHGERKAAVLFLEIQHAHREEGDPRDAWVHERLAEHEAEWARRR